MSFIATALKKPWPPFVPIVKNVHLLTILGNRSSTMKVVNAPMKANNKFDLVFVPHEETGD